MLSKIAKDFAACGVNSSSTWARYCIALTTLGFYVMVLHRASAWSVKRGVIGKILSRCIDLFANVISGCFISPMAKISGGLYLPHAVGVVIGQGVSIEQSVTIYQHVTLGSSSIGADAYPHIGPYVTIFANAVIVGDVSVGSHGVIGASAVVLNDVPSYASAIGNPARIRMSSTRSVNASGGTT